MSDSTNFLRELLELDERQDATNVEPQVTSSPVYLLEAKTLNLLLGRLPMSQLFNLQQLHLQVLSL